MVSSLHKQHQTCLNLDMIGWGKYMNMVQTKIPDLYKPHYENDEAMIRFDGWNALEQYMLATPDK